MTTKLFITHDSKVGAYVRPFCMQYTGDAIRAFEHAVASPDTEISRSPGDFTLCEIGEIDSETGLVKAYPTIINLRNGLDCVKPEQKVQPLQQLKAAENA